MVNAEGPIHAQDAVTVPGVLGSRPLARLGTLGSRLSPTNLGQSYFTLAHKDSEMTFLPTLPGCQSKTTMFQKSSGSSMTLSSMTLSLSTHKHVLASL